MYSYDNPDDCLSIVQMNSELQHAQLELLSAHCAIHQLRLHYSSDDLARFGRRDVLRKAAEAASSLNEFYLSIEKKICQTGQVVIIRRAESPDHIPMLVPAPSHLASMKSFVVQRPLEIV